MGNHKSRTSTSIFDDEEKEFIYKLPLNHDKYYYISIYRKIGVGDESTTFKQVVDFKLLDSTLTNYPFHKQIENSVLPYVGDDSKERLMRKHSKAILSSTNNNNNNNNLNNSTSLNSTSTSTTNYNSMSASSQSSALSSTNSITATTFNSNNNNLLLESKRIYDPIYSTMEEYHFLHPNNDSSTINIDVIVMRRNSFDDQQQQQHSNNNSNKNNSTIAIVGAVCDIVSKEERKSCMLKIRDICINVLNQCYYNNSNTDNNSNIVNSTTIFDNISISKEDQALKNLTDSIIKLTSNTTNSNTTNSNTIEQ